MFDDPTPPVMRGDLFALLDPDPSDDALTPERIAAGARALLGRVRRGERAPGAPLVMACLTELAGVALTAPGTGEAFSALDRIRRRLSAPRTVHHDASMPWPQTRERVVVLPQRRSASLVRAMPVGDGYFVMTREAAPSARPVDVELGDGERPGAVDAALGSPIVPPVDVTFRLFRFGPTPSDIRLVMRIVQEAGTYREVLCAGDGERIVALSRDVVGVFDGDGKAMMSGRIPLDPDVTSGAEVTAMAIEGDILALNMRSAAERPVELALLNLSERRGLPIGTVGGDASALALGDRCAYVIDGLNLVRVPLFQPGVDVSVIRLRPWFAEYPWRPRKHLVWDGGRVWVCNGDKLVAFDGELRGALGELVLPRPVVDLTLRDGELSLVTFDPDLSVARITRYDVS